MSSSVDSRVVTMKFDNAAFAKNVSSTLSMLDRLKAATQFTGASKGIDGLNASAKNFNLNGMESSINGISGKFLALSTVAVTAISNIVNRAVNAGVMITKSLTIDPIMGGLREYETNINSIQTILANTQASGAKLKDVNRTLEELNHYSDQTIYNFSEMARNIGTFTAAGVDLKTSAASIKGIANLAALSGSNSQQAATAMYQLSQAIASGRVSLMDWNSVVNAGMGGATFQRALAETAVAMGVIDEKAVSLQGKMKNVRIEGASFRDSIMAKPGSESWLTTDVLTSTLEQFTGDLKDAELAAMGFNKEQIKAIQQTAKTAKDAATKVKTLSGVLDTAKEVAGSGWAKTWQIVFGDFLQARKLFTATSNAVNEVISSSAKARNKLLADWAAQGGRDALFEGISNIFKAIGSLIKPIQQAFRDIFPATTGKQLADLTEGFRDFTEKLIMSKDTMRDVRDVFRGIFGVVGLVIDGIKGIVSTFISIAGIASSGTDSVLAFAGSIGRIVYEFTELIRTGEYIPRIFEFLNNAREKLLTPVIDGLGQLIEYFGRFFEVVSGGAATGLVDLFEKAAPAISKVKDLIGEFVSVVKSKFGQINFPSAEALGAKVLSGLSRIRDFVAKMDFSKVKEFGNTLADAFSKVTDRLREMDFSKINDLGDKVADVFGKIADKIQSIDFSSLSGIGRAITDAFAGVVAFFKNLDFSGASKSLGRLKTAASPLAGVGDRIRTAWEGAADAFTGLPGIVQPIWEFVRGILSGLNTQIKDVLDSAGIDTIAEAVASGFLVTFGVMVLRIMNSFRKIGDAAANLQNAGAGLLEGFTGALGTMQNALRAEMLFKIAAAVLMLAGAIWLLSTLNPKQIAVGTGAIAALMTTLVVGMNKLYGITSTLQGGVKMVAIVVAINGIATAMILMAGALAILGNMDQKTVYMGLANVAAILTAVGVAFALMSKAAVAGGTMLAASIAIGILAVSLSLLAGTLKLYSVIPWETIRDGLLKLLPVLVGVGIAMRAMPTKGMLGASIGLAFVAGSMLLMADALKKMATMSWEEVGKGLVALGGAMLILAAAILAFNLAKGGIGALLLAVGAVLVLTPAIKALGELSLWEITKALIGIAGVFVVLGAAALLLAPLSPVILLLAGAVTLLGIGIAGIGAGMKLFVDGIRTLSMLDAGAMNNVTNAIKRIASTIPTILREVGKGIVVMIKTIANSSAAITAAAVKIMTAFLNGVIKVAPKAAQAFVVVVRSGLAAIRAIAPDIIRTAFFVINAFLRELDRNAYRFGQSAVGIVTKFIKGIGSQSPKIIREGTSMVLKLAKGISTELQIRAAIWMWQAKMAAGDLIDGLVEGIRDGASRVVAEIIVMAYKAIAKAKSVFGINSPSKVFAEIGHGLPEGGAKGVKGGTGEMVRAVEGMAYSSISAFDAAMANARAQMPSIDGMAPVIRPVLDLSSVSKDAGQIGSMFANPTLTTNVSSAQAASLMDANVNSGRGGSGEGTVRDVTLNFEQTNNSPVALADSEIYRNTNGIVNRAKEALKVGIG